MSQYICPHCKQPIFDDDALLCHFCGESLERESRGGLGKIRKPKPKWLLFVIVLVVILSFLVLFNGAYAPIPSWKQAAYQNIVSSSSSMRRRELPLQKRDFQSGLEFLEPGRIKDYDIVSVIIVLGNMPLDESTPTIDMTYRALKGAELLAANPKSIMVITGGKTAGRISEAEMMGVIAASRGADPGRIWLEESSRTTAENAEFTARLLKDKRVAKTYIISKIEHLEWAVPYFRKYGVFKNIEPVDCGVSFEEIVRDMENYLKTHQNKTVRQRLENVKRDYKGVD